MTAAGLDWEVEKVQLQYGVTIDGQEWSGYGETVPDEYHLVRTDNSTQLSTTTVTKDNYDIRQNADMFSVFEPFLEDGTMVLNTGGSLFNGQRVWALAQLQTGFALPGEDKVNNFLLYTINHSGKGANTAFYTPVRVVCNNTLRQAVDGADHTIRDTHKLPFHVGLMRKAIVAVKTQSVDFEEFAGRMADCDVTASQQLEFFRKVYGFEKDKETKRGTLEDHPPVLRAMQLLNGIETKEKTEKLTQKQKLQDAEDRANQLMSAIEASVRQGKVFDRVPDDLLDDTIDKAVNVNPGWELKSSEGTLWGLYNVATYSEDFAPTMAPRSADHRAQRALWGPKQGNDIKTRAVEVAREMLEAA
jgi:phage/plasmid-like protein (TIGR03299 family)